MMIKKTKPIKETGAEKAAVRVTELIGTPLSIAVHTVIFVLAFFSILLGVIPLPLYPVISKRNKRKH
jgi:hypothetical protein